mmetsp:Transcript_67010/g.158035  ORF Transcript_67010/g.158035 Transcript_67010/m.158035 type:complete len:627 (+) Transcript_67010:42-1922(+)
MPSAAKPDAQGSEWWSRFRSQHGMGYIVQAAKVIGSDMLGLSNMVLKDREKGFKPRCDFTVTSIDTAMVEGVVLRGSLLLPKGLDGPFPSILMRTPYGRKGEMGQSFLARQGYAVLVQDTRGRFSSSGEFVPVQHEQMDGAATVAWMRKQTWCNGKVGATGGSYLGFTAWACVDGSGLDAIVPIITQSNLRSAIFRPGGAVSFELVVLWFYLVLHLMKDLHHDPLSLPKKLWQGMREGKLRRAFRSLPIGKVDDIILGSRNDFFQDGLDAHGNETSRFWEGKEKLCSFERAIPPCHILTGWYDFFLEGAVEDFAKAAQKGGKVSLTIAPIHHWSIIGFRNIYERTMLTTFDDHLKGDGSTWSVKDPERSQLSPATASSQGQGDWTAPVHLYILGMGWQHYETYPPPSRSARWHLGAAFQLAREAGGHKDLDHSYLYDPARPTPAAGGPSFNPMNAGARDQGKIEARSDVLVYTSAALPSPLVIAGPVHLKLEAAWETEKADFVGRLCHVGLDGRSTNLCEGLTSVTVKPGKSGRQQVEVSLGHIAALFRPGERIRLQLCSAAHPRWFRNLGTAEKLLQAKKLSSGRVRLLAGVLTLPEELSQVAWDERPMWKVGWAEPQVVIPSRL